MYHINMLRPVLLMEFRMHLFETFFDLELGVLVISCKAHMGILENFRNAQF